jgi:hypothetical protein
MRTYLKVWERAAEDFFSGLLGTSAQNVWTAPYCGDKKILRQPGLLVGAACVYKVLIERIFGKLLK